MISLQSKGLSRVFSSITDQKPQFLSAWPSLWSSCIGSYLWHTESPFWHACSSLQHLGSEVSLLELCPMACVILPPQPGAEPMFPALEGRFLTTGPPGKSLMLQALCHQVCIFMQFSWKDTGGLTVVLMPSFEPRGFSRNLPIRATDLSLRITVSPSDKYWTLGWSEQKVQGQGMVQ